MTMAKFVRGNPVRSDYLPAANYCAGDVIIFGDLPMVATADNPPSTSGYPAAIQGALAVGGGVYQVAADAAYPVGEYVYWNSSTSQVTMEAAGAYPFGWIIAGPLGRVDDGGPTGAASTCFVLHSPSGSAGTINLATGVTANDNVANTTSTTNFATTATIPAKFLRVDDVIRVRAMAVVNSNHSTDTVKFGLVLGTTTIWNTTAAAPANNDVGYFDFDILVTANGASGSIQADGVANQGTPGTATARLANLAAAAINTNAALVLAVQTTWNVANAGDVAQLTNFTAQILRK